jgi:hypothetical protein
MLNCPINDDDKVLVIHLEERSQSIFSESWAEDIVEEPQMKPFFRGIELSSQSALRGGAKLIYMNLVLSAPSEGTSRNVNK